MTFDFLHHGVVRNVMIEKAPSSPESWKEWVPPSGWQGSTEDPFVPSCVHGMASRG